MTFENFADGSPRRDLAAMVGHWLDRAQFQALFTRACCMHFAVVAHERGLGDLWFTESKYDKRFKAHVFILSPDELAFDVNGYNDVSTMLAYVADWSESAIKPTTLADVARDIDSLAFERALHARIFDAARSVLDAVTRSPRAR